MANFKKLLNAVTEQVTAHPIYLFNCLMMIVVGGGEQIFENKAFECPKDPVAAREYTVWCAMVPCVVLLLGSMLVNSSLWRVWDGCCMRFGVLHIYWQIFAGVLEISCDPQRLGLYLAVGWRERAQEAAEAFLGDHAPTKNLWETMSQPVSADVKGDTNYYTQLHKWFDNLLKERKEAEAQERAEAEQKKAEAEQKKAKAEQKKAAEEERNRAERERVREEGGRNRAELEQMPAEKEVVLSSFQQHPPEKERKRPEVKKKPETKPLMEIPESWEVFRQFSKDFAGASTSTS